MSKCNRMIETWPKTECESSCNNSKARFPPEVGYNKTCLDRKATTGEKLFFSAGSLY